MNSVKVKEEQARGSRNLSLGCGTGVSLREARHAAVSMLGYCSKFQVAFHKHGHNCYYKRTQRALPRQVVHTLKEDEIKELFPG